MAGIPDVSQISNISNQLHKPNAQKPHIDLTESAETPLIPQEEAVYIPNDENAEALLSSYKPDMDKINAMKEETEQRMLDLLRETIKGGTLKQIGGLREFVAKFNTQEAVDALEASPEAIAKAQEDISETGYWGVEATSERFLDFAKALSGGDKSKGTLLLDAVKEGYKQAEEIWGSKLPELSEKTLARTVEKFEEWMNS
jgi:hypothetical protein